MTDIKELALRVAKERMPDMPDEWYAEEVERGVRLIAAYCAEQKPVGEVIGFFDENKMPRVSWFNAYPDKGTKLFTAPPEPAPTVDPHWLKIDMDISEKNAAQLQDQVENLAALVNRLCRQVNRFDSGNAVAVAASKYICDNDLIGTSLRKDDEGIQKIIDMAKENSND